MNDFATSRGLSLSPTVPSFGGALFEFLQERSVADRFTSPSFEVGNLSGTVGGSQSRSEGAWTVTSSLSTTAKRTYGYVSLQLETMLPHLVLDSRRNIGRFGGSSIPMPIAGGQTLSLEGDFDTYFRLHCPAGYERDALYVFTPDLMALLIDETGDFDVEIVDDRLFIYAHAAFDLSSAELWMRLDRIRSVVGAKALRQTERYRDDRGGPTSPLLSASPLSPASALSSASALLPASSLSSAASPAAAEVAPGGRRLRMGFLGGNGSARGMIFLVIGIFVVVLAIIGGVGVFVINAVLSTSP
ncbi:MAG: hypothetical protein ACOH1T_07660 [Microbacteriaceae bacterium]